MNNDLKAFAVISENGEILQILQTNEKGYRKSIENNQLWALNPDTGRLLPEDTAYKITGFREKSTWYEARVKAGSADQPESKKEVRKADPDDANTSASVVIESLYGVIKQRKKNLPEGSYTTHLFNSGMSKIKKKTGEEAIELLLAENREEMIYEAADLIYHMLVMLAAADIEPEDIFCELQKRE